MAVLRERYVLPTVEETLGLLGEARVFSKLDANSGFYQTNLSPEGQELTIFISPFGRYCFTRMPFCITSAPQYFQKISEALSGLPGVVNMMDDILLYGRNEVEHDCNLEKALERLVASGITLNEAKCKFRAKEIAFLGYLINESGINPDPDKVKAVKNLPPRKMHQTYDES